MIFEPKALACYGLLVRWVETGGSMLEQSWLRFVDGRPLSRITTAFLKWSCDKLEVLGKKALLLVWDNASWHISKEVRSWIREHNRQVKAAGEGIRISTCQLPVRSPWLNPIEPRWIHGKRRVVESDRLLTAGELVERVYASFGCHPENYLAIPEKLP